MNKAMYITIDGKQYRVAFSFLGLRESQQMARQRAKDGNSEVFDDVIQSNYCFLKHGNEKASDRNEVFAYTLEEFEKRINEDFALYKQLIEAYAFVMSSMVEGLKSVDEGTDCKSAPADADDKKK